MAPLRQCFPWRKTELSNLRPRIFLVLEGRKRLGVFPAGSAAPAAEPPKLRPRQQVPAPGFGLPFTLRDLGPRTRPTSTVASPPPPVWKGDNRLAFMRSWD